MIDRDYTDELYGYEKTAVLAVFFAVSLESDVYAPPAGVLYFADDSLSWSSSDPLCWRTADMAQAELMPSANVGIRRFFELVRKLAISSQAWGKRGYCSFLEFEERPKRLAQLQVSGANLQLLTGLRSVSGDAWKQA